MEPHAPVPLVGLEQQKKDAGHQQQNVAHCAGDVVRNGWRFGGLDWRRAVLRGAATGTHALFEWGTAIATNRHKCGRVLRAAKILSGSRNQACFSASGPITGMTSFWFWYALMITTSHSTKKPSQISGLIKKRNPPEMELTIKK